MPRGRSFPASRRRAAATDAPARGERAERLKSRMEAVRAEVHLVPSETWLDAPERNSGGTRKVATLLYAPQTAIGEAACGTPGTRTPPDLPELVAYAGRGRNVQGTASLPWTPP